MRVNRHLFTIAIASALLLGCGGGSDSPPPGGGDTQAPTATLTAPADLAANLPGSVTLSATATDNVGVASVEFQVDGTTVATVPGVPYNTTVDTTVYASGQHVVRARARDAAGNASAWSAATVQFGGTRAQPSGFTRNGNWFTNNNLANATAFAQAPDGRWFVAQQGGRLRIIENNDLRSTDFMTLTVDATGERGLLGVAIHPEFGTNPAKRFIYIYHTVPGSPAHNRITRVTPNTVNPNIVSVGSDVIIADLPNLSGQTNHNGGAMHFGSDGKLYVAVGDNAVGANAQSMTTRLGKMLRLDDDGSIPNDNPFFATATGDNRAIWATGLRNPYTFAVRAGDGRMHINDVGEGTWEEVNVGAAGANYGWPTSEGPTNAAGVTGPLYAYDHDANTNPGGFFSGCAIAGGAFYGDSGPFPAAYRNSYYFADFCSRFVARLDLNADASAAAVAFGSLAADPVDMRVGADGALYVLTRGGITRFSAP
jgi:glucose/arabinose dehydrogenase